jgi:hypothetical protein
MSRTLRESQDLVWKGESERTSGKEGCDQKRYRGGKAQVCFLKSHPPVLLLLPLS